MKWKSIKTVPKDGSIILLYAQGFVHAGFWNGNEERPWTVLVTPSSEYVRPATNFWRESTPEYWRNIPKFKHPK